MNLKFKYLGLLFCALLCVGTSMTAKVERTTVYMFGFSAAFTDSVAYITDIQQLDSAYIETKTDFLMSRSVYSGQLQTYLETLKGMPDCTCAIFFNTKKSKLIEEYNKVKKRYEKNGSVILNTLDSGLFTFQSPSYEDVTNTVTEEPKPKAKKKRRDRKAAKEQSETQH